MNIPFKLSLPILILLKPFSSLPVRIWNLARRPRLAVTMKYRQFEFKLENGEKRIYDIPFISVTNNSKAQLKIKAKSIRFNGEAYSCFVQSDNLFAHHYGEGTHVVLAEANPALVYRFYKDNWLEILQGIKYLTIEPNQELLFPLRLIGTGLTRLNFQIKHSKLFFGKKKLSFIISHNDNTYEYGINRMDCYNVYMNYLASHTSRYYKHNYL